MQSHRPEARSQASCPWQLPLHGRSKNGSALRSQNNKLGALMMWIVLECQRVILLQDIDEFAERLAASAPCCGQCWRPIAIAARVQWRRAPANGRWINARSATSESPAAIMSPFVRKISRMSAVTASCFFMTVENHIDSMLSICTYERRPTKNPAFRRVSHFCNTAQFTER